MGGVNLVVGFRPELRRAVAPGGAPEDLVVFDDAIVGQDSFVMPATQHDAVLWLSGSAYDVVFDTARAAIAELVGLAAVAEETSSWPYRHNLDLTGFIDGTENPTVVEAGTSCSYPTARREAAARCSCSRSGPTTPPPGSRSRPRRRRR